MKDLATIFLEQLESGQSVQNALYEVDEALRYQRDMLRDVISEYSDDVLAVADEALFTKIL